jgi:DNA-directed RNA polymerase subunit E'/Rpb7
MPIDGLVHISNIPGDYWELDRGGMGLVGRRTGRRWKMGDKVQVRLARVDLAQRQIDFELVEAGVPSKHTHPSHGGRHDGGRHDGGRSNRQPKGGRGSRRRRD